MNIPENLEIDFKDYEKLTLIEAVEAMNEMRKQLDSFGEVKSYYQKIYDHLRMTRVPEIMDNDAINTITFDDIGRVTLTSDIYASIPTERKDDAWDWLRDNNHGGIIKETINAGTLKATLKVIIKKGELLPPDLFKVTPYSRASITKVK